MDKVKLITIDKEKCVGCNHCVRICPVGAIKLIEGIAYIESEKCIDCGDCIEDCLYDAVCCNLDSLSSINFFEIRIAIPDPVLFSQFRLEYPVQQLENALKQIGFTHVCYVSKAFELDKDIKPLISSSCPAIIGLIKSKFPELIINIIKTDLVQKVVGLPQLDSDKEESDKQESSFKTGIFYITPCVAKARAMKKPFFSNVSKVDGIISIAEIFSKMVSIVTMVSNSQKSIMSVQNKHNQDSYNFLQMFETVLPSKNNYRKSMCVDGIYNVISVFEKLQRGELIDVDYIEAFVCNEGCVGGVLTVENSYIAKSRINKIINEDIINEDIINEDINYDYSMIKIDRNFPITKSLELDNIYNDLPGLDCGACGAKGCRGLAGDILNTSATKSDCVVLQNIQKLGF